MQCLKFDTEILSGIGFTPTTAKDTKKSYAPSHGKNAFTSHAPHGFTTPSLTTVPPVHVFPRFLCGVSSKMTGFGTKTGQQKNGRGKKKERHALMKAKMYRRWIHADEAERGLFNCPFRGEECAGESCPLWLEHPKYDVYGTCTLSPSVEFDAEEHPCPEEA